LPRAALAVDLSEVTPIAVKSPTLLADTDPYNSLKPTSKPEPAPQPAAETVANQKTDSAAAGESGVKTANIDGRDSGYGTQTAQSAPEIRKAIPVQPQDKKPVEIRRAIPIKPLDQQGEDESLLKSATPPPGDLEE
jgi:hypothetical protein